MSKDELEKLVASLLAQSGFGHRKGIWIREQEEVLHIAYSDRYRFGNSLFIELAIVDKKVDTWEADMQSKFFHIRSRADRLLTGDLLIEQALDGDSCLATEEREGVLAAEWAKVEAMFYRRHCTHQNIVQYCKTAKESTYGSCTGPLKRALGMLQ